jgi:hypothetical protein
MTSHGRFDYCYSHYHHKKLLHEISLPSSPSRANKKTAKIMAMAPTATPIPIPALAPELIPKLDSGGVWNGAEELAVDTEGVVVVLKGVEEIDEIAGVDDDEVAVSGVEPTVDVTDKALGAGALNVSVGLLQFTLLFLS